MTEIENPHPTWCITCGNPVENDQCACWCFVAEALQRHLAMDFDTSADVAAKMWAATDQEQKIEVWNAVYANSHDVPVYEDPRTQESEATVPTMKMPTEVTPAERATAVLCAVQRELPERGLSAADWDEIKDKSLADLLAANTDAHVDGWWDAPPTEEADLNEIVTLVRVGSVMLGTNYLAQLYKGIDEFDMFDVDGDWCQRHGHTGVQAGCTLCDPIIEADRLNHPHDETCPRCGRRAWTDEQHQETCQACGYVLGDDPENGVE